MILRLNETGPIGHTTRLFAGFLLSMILASGCGIYVPSDAEWIPAEVAPRVVGASSPEPAWLRTDIYIGGSAGDIDLVASDSKVFFFGSVDVDQPSRIIALDAWTGELVWQTDPRPGLTMLADNDALYVGQQGGGGTVSKYDLDTGERLWSRSFWRATGVEHLIKYEERLHAYLVPDIHRILRTSDGATIFAVFPSQPPLLDSTTCGPFLLDPIYTKDTAIFRSDWLTQLGRVCAVDLTTGELRWKTDLKVISNAVLGQGAVFMLVEDGRLLALDPSTGQEVEVLEIAFDNGPLLSHTREAGSTPHFVAYEDANDILFVYLGDSRQLFSFVVGGD